MKKRPNRLLLVIFVMGILALFIPVIVALQGKQSPFFPEPAVRPDINPAAVWDEAQGVYVLPDDEYEQSLMPVSPDSIAIEPEDIWMAAHPRNTDNKIDKAIYAYLDGYEPPANSKLSVIPPLKEESAFLNAIDDLDLSCVPELWRRIYQELEMRAFFIAAFECLLDIDPNEHTYTTEYMQELWRDDFLTLRGALPDADAITASDVQVYGKLLLPVLADQLKAAPTEQTQAILSSVLEPELAELSATLSAQAQIETWIDNNQVQIDAVKEMLTTDWEWVAAP